MSRRLDGASSGVIPAPGSDEASYAMVWSPAGATTPMKCGMGPGWAVVAGVVVVMLAAAVLLGLSVAGGRAARRRGDASLLADHALGGNAAANETVPVALPA